MRKLTAFIAAGIFCLTSTTAFAAVAKTQIYTVAEIIQFVSTSYTGEITKVDLEKSTTGIYYEVDVLSSTTKTELIIDAKTGKVLKNYEEALDSDEKYIYNNFTQAGPAKAKLPATPATPSTSASSNASGKVTTSIISEELAKKTALARIGGGTITKSKLDVDDGVTRYEIKIIYGKYEYEIDVDATTGKIIGFDKDYIHD